MIAYVLINTEIGATSEVLETVKKNKNVTEAHSVYGTYDIVAKVETESLNKLKTTVTLKIRRIDEVRSTLTMIVMEEP